MKCLIDLHYLPSLEYFSSILRFDIVRIEKHEHFIKQNYRNRCCINTANGVSRLTIPLTAKSGKPRITDIKIDYSQKWLNNHWRAIESAYRNAPFFEHYQSDLHQSLFRKHTFLYDLNFELLTTCLNWLKSELRIEETLLYETVPESGIHDLRNTIQTKKSKNNTTFFNPVAYQQVFGKSFAENLSIIDLIFCEGPNAGNIIRASTFPSEQIKSQ